MKLIKLYILCVCFFIGHAQSEEEPFQLHGHYKIAAANTTSSGTSYVLIKLVNALNNKTTFACLTANFLSRAIHLEHDIPYTDAGIQKAKKIAISNTNHTFTFSNKKAIHAASMSYTIQELETARKQLKLFSYYELIEGFKPRGKLHRLYVFLPRAKEKRDALACALIERHIFVGLSGSANLETF